MWVNFYFVHATNGDDHYATRHNKTSHQVAHTQFWVGSGRVWWRWPISSLDRWDFVIARLLCVRQFGHFDYFASRRIVAVV